MIEECVKVYWFARQQWRAWIETAADSFDADVAIGSPASNGGRGLKLNSYQVNTVIEAGSPASNGGRGLKLLLTALMLTWPSGSPASNGGRGLKPDRKRTKRQGNMVRPPAMAGVD